MMTQATFLGVLSIIIMMFGALISGRMFGLRRYVAALFSLAAAGMAGILFTIMIPVSVPPYHNLLLYCALFGTPIYIAHIEFLAARKTQ